MSEANPRLADPLAVGDEEILQADGLMTAGVRRRRSQWAQLLGDTLRYRRTRVGLAMLMGVAIVVLVGPYLAPYSPYEFVGAPFAGPSSTALLGTDDIGRDVLSRVLYGGRTVVGMAVAATTVGMVFGIALGLIAGYGRRLIDESVMRLLDAFMAFPQIVLALLVMSILGARLWLLVLSVGISHAPRVARVVRSATLEIKELDFVTAAESLGVSRMRIAIREILPMLSSPLAVEVGLRMTYSIGLVAALSFIGFGMSPPAADWGLMLNENRIGLTLQPYSMFVPAACIAILTVGFNFVTDGMARAMIGIDRDTGTG